MKPSAWPGQSVNAYAEGPPRQVLGFFGLHRMTTMLLAERTPSNGRVLVLGAGGGLELKAFAESNSGWSFDGVDPSADMLRLAEQMVAPHVARINVVFALSGNWICIPHKVLFSQLKATLAWAMVTSLHP